MNKIMTDAEWASLSAESRHEINKYGMEFDRLTAKHDVLVAWIAELETQKTQRCQWNKDEYAYSNLWSGSCGIEYELISDTPSDNDMIYCPRCGKKIVMPPQMPEGEA